MKKIIYGLLILFLIISCALESKFGLPNDEKINTKLIGIWYNEKIPNESVIIKPNGEMKYKLILSDSTELISYSKRIKGFNILNIISDYKGKTINTFYGFVIKNETLEFYEVNKEMRKIEFDSQAELIHFFNENVDKKEFFINPVKLTRK